MSEFIEKRWDLPTMERRVENLKKVINSDEVESRLNFYLSCLTDNRLDALYLTYYSLKGKYSNVNKINIGSVKPVSYGPKKPLIPNTDAYWWFPYGSSNHNWTITTSTNTL